VSPFVIVLAVGVVLHTIVGVITRTPEEDQTPLRWKAWHTFLTGLASTALIVAVVIGYHLATGVMLPFWALLLAVDLLTLGWKLREHHKRVQERQALKSLFDRPSHGEA
jgi:high-affinity Fe2+/Pb2+ permease